MVCVHTQIITHSDSPLCRLPSFVPPLVSSCCLLLLMEMLAPCSVYGCLTRPNIWRCYYGNSRCRKMSLINFIPEPLVHLGAVKLHRCCFCSSCCFIGDRPWTRPQRGSCSGWFLRPLGRSLWLSAADEALDLTALLHMMQLCRNYLWARLGSIPISCLSGRDGGRNEPGFV